MTVKKTLGTGLQIGAGIGMCMTAFGAATGGLGLAPAAAFAAWDAATYYAGSRLANDGGPT